MKKIKQLLHAKGTDVWSVGPDALVYEALQLMAEKQVGALVVLEGDRVVGIISERDYARNVILKDRSSRETLVREIMSTRVVFAEPHHTVEEGLALMTNKRIRHLPVMDGERLIGVVSIGDLVKAIINEQRSLIDQLERYITSY